jgi:hypothetical protein
MATPKKKPRRLGHPPTGIRPGEKSSEYQRMTIRLPDDVRSELDALGVVLVRPQWRVLVDAIKAYAGTGPTTTEETRREVRKYVRDGARVGR